MKLRLHLLAALLVTAVISGAQTFTNRTGGIIPDAGTLTYYPVTVSGVGNINSDYGLATVCLNINHKWTADLEIYLKAPDGTTVPLSIQNGFSGDNYESTCFRQGADVRITQGIPPFSGEFVPEGDMSVINNGQNADGVWNLCILDRKAPDTGVLKNFSLTFNSSPARTASAAADNPCNATLLSPSITCTWQNYTTVGATPTTGVPAPGCASYLGGDVWFKVVVPAGGWIKVDTREGTMTDGGMALYKGSCGSLALISCDDNSSTNGNMPYINAQNLIPGDTVWIRFWGKGPANFGTFDICITVPPPPSVQDCPGAIPLCQAVYSTTASYSGTGTIPNEINTTNSCLSSGEKNDVWYTFTVSSSGNLAFTITPNNLGDDYDWAVYNLTNATCADIYTNSALDVSCNYSATPGATGPNGSGTSSNNGAGGPPFNAVIPVTAGQTYVVNVSNFSSSQFGYTINFGASTAGIYDSVKPKLKSVVVDPCGSNMATVGFSENVLCSTLQAADFDISGPGGPYTITALSSPSCGIGATYGNVATVSTSPAMTTPGSYLFCLTSASGSVGDLCGNVAVTGAPSCRSFTISPHPALGNDTTVKRCTGGTVNLTTLYNTTGLTPSWTFGGNPVANPSSVTAAGVYQLIVSNSGGCKDTARVTFVIIPNTTSTTNVAVCQAQIPYTWNGNTYNAAGTYTDTIPNAAGCDSIMTLNLSVKPNTTSTTRDSICASQYPYSWNGNTYNTAGTYTDTIPNAAGCDSAMTLILTTLPSPTDTVRVSVCQAQLPYTWNGNSYNAAGTYSATFPLSTGCDSVARLILTVRPPSTSTTNVAVCPNLLPYAWNGNNYNASGTYNVTLTNSVGCDSVATLNLTVKPTSTSNTNVAVCPNQLPYPWNGNNYNAAGTYSVTLTNSVGCDSVATLHLTVKPTSTSTTSVAVCQNLMPYAWNGNSYNTAGSYNVTLTNSAGCDSVATLVLSVKPTSTSTTTVTVCQNQLPYSWNGNSYNAAGTYTKTLTNSVGCDSVARLVLTIKPTSTSTTNVAVCPNQLPYTWNGNNYSASGSYNVTLTNSAGCDSIATLVLAVKPTSTSTTNVAVCPNQLPYTWNGNSYNAAGTYTKTLTNSVGCDSVATLVLSIKPTSTSSTNAAVCPNQVPYLWNGNSYNTAGTYNVTLVNSVGCDSVATLNLTVKPTSTSTTSVAVCQNLMPYAWNGNSYNTAGTYNVTLVNSVGCDSVATLVLTVKPTSTSTTSVSVCQNLLPYTWNGNSYNAAGTYTKTLVNSVGCDSVATLILIVKPTSTSTTNVAVCPNQLPYLWNGNSYNAAGTYTKTLVNSAGCDSIATLVLAVKPRSTSTTNVAVCPNQLPYTWNGNSYNAAGTYTKTLTNSVGCDSVATLVLSVKPTSTSSTNVAICPNQIPYLWNGNSYNAAGTYNVTLVNSVGCDSVATLVLAVKSTSASTTNTSVCQNLLPYLWNGNSYNTAGSYIVTLVNSIGCDSVATLVLAVKPTSTSTTNVAVCPSQLPYSWNGNSYNTAGTYTKTLVNSVGCDSVATLILVVKPTSTSTTNVAVCPNQLPYLWNGNSYNAAGTYTKTLINSVGCDSVATLVLALKPTSTSTTNVAVCPNQLPYSWNGNSYNAAGTYTKTLTNSVGCDSVATLVLSVKPTSTSTTNVAICPNQIPYLWNGNSYNAAGTYTVTLVNSVGCDSVATLVLAVKSNSASTTNTSVCQNLLPYLWNGNSYNAAGSYNVTLVNSGGCDSVATLVLTVKPTSTSTTNVAVCPSQLPYLWNGNSYNAAGTYTKILVNSVGCDSVATLVLSVKPTSTSTTNVAVCPTQLPYLWNGNSYNAAGTYTKTLVNSVGCDSVATLVLTVKPTSTSTTNVAVCPTQLPYTWNGNSYNAAGTYTKTLTNSVGCDSVATLVLSVKLTSTSTTNIPVCPNQLPYLWNGNSYNAAGTYNVTLVNSVGCDSVAKLVLVVKPTSASITNVAVCPNQLPYLWNGNSYNAAGTYTKTLVNSVGCDSVATLVLVVKPTSASTTNVAVCPSQLPYSWNGNSYNAAGTYTKTLVNSVGCDSIATLVLVVKSTSASTTTVAICPVQLPYTWNGSNYNAGGTYTKTFTNSVGCDSVATLVLTINPVPATPAVTSNAPVCSGNTLMLNIGNIVSGATYKWTGPNLFTSSITDPVIYNSQIAHSGTYSAIATLNGCVSAAGSVSVTIRQTPIANAGPDKQVYEGDSVQLSPVIYPAISYLWTPTTDMISLDTVKGPWVIGIADMTYYLTVSNGTCVSKPDAVFVRVLPRLEPIFIPNVFSPNGDGVNDKWAMRELVPYPEATVDVFTRYGSPVYHSNGYKQAWDGTSNGKALPVGTYYYIIRPTKLGKPITGWVQIVR